MARSLNDATDDLTPAERADIEGLYLKMGTGTLYEFLGVGENVDKKIIRDGYFVLSKQFHPDAYFGRNLGKYRARLDELFRQLTVAYETLSNRQQRAEYDVSIGLAPNRKMDPPPTPADPQAVRDALRQTGPIVAGIPGGSAARATGEQAVIPPPLRSTGEGAALRTPMPKPPAPVERTSAEIARAKEGLAHKLRGNWTSTGETAAISPSHPTNTAGALRAQFANREDLAVASKIDALRDSARRLEATGDFGGAANTMQIAMGILPNDEGIRQEYERLHKRGAIQHLAQNQTAARDAEKAGDWQRAYQYWQKALVADPLEYSANLQSGFALLYLRRDLPKAAEFARKALGANPRSVNAYVLLAEIFLVAEKPASARRAAEEAAKLDPTSATVKDVLIRSR